MLEYIAFILIIFGVYFIISGLRDSTQEYVLKQPLPEYDYEPFGEGEEDDYEYVLEKKKRRKTEVKGGGVILIGPIPIVFGDSRIAFYTLILTIVLMILSIIFILIAAGVIP